MEDPVLGCPAAWHVGFTSKKCVMHVQQSLTRVLQVDPGYPNDPNFSWAIGVVCKLDLELAQELRCACR